MTEPETPKQLLPAQPVLDTLDEWARIVFENEQSFINKFAGWAEQVIHIDFNSECAKPVYLNREGDHVIGTIPIQSFLEWARRDDKESDGTTPSCADIRALMAKIFVARNISMDNKGIVECLETIDSWYSNKEGGN